MKITPTFTFKNSIGAALAAGALLVAPFSAKAQTGELNTEYVGDTFETSVKVTPAGTSEKSVLIMAPNPEVEIAGETVNAAIVVDLSKNVLYHYNEYGEADKAYLVASGKKRYPTDTGIRVVTHCESYPYKSAPVSTKRRKQPWNYGPRVICLETVNPDTGARGKTGEFIHGNNNPDSLGKYASLGCIRMDNTVIKELAAQVKRGDIVLIKKDSL